MTLINDFKEDAEPLGEPPSFTNTPEEQVERSMNLPTRLRRFLNCALKSERGFSMAELMVAVGVSGTLALGTMQLAGLQTKSQIADDLMNAQMSADMLIKNKQACTNSLNGIPITGLPRAIPNGLGKANDDSSSSVHRCEPTGENCGLRISPRAADITEPNIDAINKSSDFVVFGNNVMVKSITLTQFKEIKGEKGAERAQDQIDSGTGAARVNAGIAEINIEFAVKDRSRSIGIGNEHKGNLRIVNKYILTTVSVDASGRIQDCELPDEQAVLEADYELCESLGGSYGNNKCAGGTEALADTTRQRMCERIGGSYSAGNDTCVPPWYSCSCPPGEYVIGFDAESNLANCSGGGTCTP